MPILISLVCSFRFHRAIGEEPREVGGMVESGIVSSSRIILSVHRCGNFTKLKMQMKISIRHYRERTGVPLSAIDVCYQMNAPIEGELREDVFFSSCTLCHRRRRKGISRVKKACLQQI